MALIQAPDSAPKRLMKTILRKALILAVSTVVFGFLYSWASPWAFPAGRQVGFAHGMLHGAMMPLSLPSLVTGHDVQIYDENNSGRFYKIGYICGVNICGLVFIGPLFWRPRTTSANCDKSR
jgi:hypothetical protein